MTTGRINQVSHRICCVCSCQPITRLLSPPRSPSAACTCTNSQSDYSCTHTLPSPTAHRDRLLRLPASSGNHTLTPPPRCPLDGSAADTSPRLCRLVDQRCLPHRISLSRTDSTRRRHAYSPDASPSRNCALSSPRARHPAGLVSLPPACCPPRRCPDQLLCPSQYPPAKLRSQHPENLPAPPRLCSSGFVYQTRKSETLYQLPCRHVFSARALPLRAPLFCLLPLDIHFLDFFHPFLFTEP